MTQLKALSLDDGTTIYMEVQEDVEVVNEPEEDGEVVRRSKGQVTPAERIKQNFQAIETTIRAYTTHTLNAFKQVGSANVDKVTLEFGIKVGGKMGIPYVTEGSTDCHLKITVESSFSHNNSENAEQ